jgi:hypothetical protein
VYDAGAMSDAQRNTLGQVVGVLQLIVLIIGIAGLFTIIGKRDQQLTQTVSDLDKLAVVVNDLARAQTSSAVNDVNHSKSLEDIQRRLGELERKIK